MEITQFLLHISYWVYTYQCIHTWVYTYHLHISYWPEPCQKGIK